MPPAACCGWIDFYNLIIAVVGAFMDCYSSQTSAETAVKFGSRIEELVAWTVLLGSSLKKGHSRCSVERRSARGDRVGVIAGPHHLRRSVDYGSLSCPVKKYRCFSVFARAQQSQTVLPRRREIIGSDSHREAHQG